MNAYPLTWPAGWPKTDPTRREQGAFKTELHTALNNLRKQVELLGGKNLILSSNYTLGVENPKDADVVAYFTWTEKNSIGQVVSETQMAIPCDRWHKVAHNVQAIALTIEAMRGMERWGAKHMIKAMFTGFKALPERTSKRPWKEVLGVTDMDTLGRTKLQIFEIVKGKWREKCKTAHPDQGGSREAAWKDFQIEQNIQL